MTNYEIDRMSDLDILQLIGRNQKLQDLSDVKSKFKNKNIIITGSSGSIGSILVKTFLKEFQFNKLICIDFCESTTFYLQQELKEYENVIFKIADVKNEIRIESIFKEFKPEIVFFASAYKHVPLMEDNPTEAYLNNVYGFQIVSSLAIKYKSEEFLYISTDKAVNPTSVMGLTKRVCELSIKEISQLNNKPVFKIVRFGNVIQSNGSVINTWKNQVKAGLELTVTHKDIQRYFMTVSEAVYLIIQSLIIGNNGDVLLFDMGEPVKVFDLAVKIDNLRDEPKGIRIIGLRKGEKMFEELSYDKSQMEKTVNDKIFLIRNISNLKGIIKSLNSITEGVLKGSILEYNIKDYLISILNLI